MVLQNHRTCSIFRILLTKPNNDRLNNCEKGSKVLANSRTCSIFRAFENKPNDDRLKTIKTLVRIEKRY